MFCCCVACISRYKDCKTVPRDNADLVESVRWELLPKDMDRVSETVMSGGGESTGIHAKSLGWGMVTQAPCRS
jgi:hypothetical protein